MCAYLRVHVHLQQVRCFESKLTLFCQVGVVSFPIFLAFFLDTYIATSLKLGSNAIYKNFDFSRINASPQKAFINLYTLMCQQDTWQRTINLLEGSSRNFIFGCETLHFYICSGMFGTFKKNKNKCHSNNVCSRCVALSLN